MREVAVVSFAQSKSVRRADDQNEVEMLMPVVSQAIANSGVPRKEIGFTISGSCDYLGGVPFAFVSGLDAVGAWPPITESHVEMDGAWALYEAWVRLQHGDIDSALVYSFGKSSLGDISQVLSQQLDPYYLAPLWPDSVSLGAIQTRSWLDSGHSEKELAQLVSRNRQFASANEHSQITKLIDPETYLAKPYIIEPLRIDDCPPVSDGACALVLVAGDRAKACSTRLAWIKGIDHRSEPHSLGVRDLSISVSTKQAGKNCGALDIRADICELHAPFSAQQAILEEALEIDESVMVNPSGGALCANPVMAAGLIRIGEAASRIINGEANCAIAHATAGPCLQQNLVCVLEGGN